MPAIESSIQEIQSSDAAFPASLREISDVPKRLYLRGDAQLLNWEPRIAVIGTRHPTEYGAEVARKISGDLARAGVCVVSGLALGIDGIAHEAALAAGGKTIAVLGSAISDLRPKTNEALGLSIVKKGLVLSEYGPGHALYNWQYSVRNRLISGLSRAVVIIESAEHSGTHVTARYALEQGREVFAVPGPITSEKSLGPLKWIREGARAVRSAEDILEDLGLRRLALEAQNQVTCDNHKEKQDPLLQWLAVEPIHMDNLLEKSGLSPSALSQRLLQLELAGQVRPLPGQRYMRCD